MAFIRLSEIFSIGNQTHTFAHSLSDSVARLFSLHIHIHLNAWKMRRMQGKMNDCFQCHYSQMKRQYGWHHSMRIKRWWRERNISLMDSANILVVSYSGMKCLVKMDVKRKRKNGVDKRFHFYSFHEARHSYIFYFFSISNW